MDNTVQCASKGIILKNNSILVLKQKVKNIYVLDLPGGKIQYGEDPINTLHREIKEEVNISVNIKKMLGTYHFFRKDNGSQIICITYLCTLLENQDIDITNNTDTNENIIEYFWCNIDYLSKNINKFPPTLIKIIKNVLNNN